jgi:ribosomal protein L31
MKADIHPKLNPVIFVDTVERFNKKYNITQG